MLLQRSGKRVMKAAAIAPVPIGDDDVRRPVMVYLAVLRRLAFS